MAGIAIITLENTTCAIPFWAALCNNQVKQDTIISMATMSAGTLCVHVPLTMYEEC